MPAPRPNDKRNPDRGKTPATANGGPALTCHYATPDRPLVRGPRTLLLRNQTTSTPHHHQHTQAARDKAIDEYSKTLRSLGANLQLVAGLEWTKHVPTHLRKRLTTPREKCTAPMADHGIPTGPIILHLYAGPDTPTALDYIVQTTAPWLSPFLHPP